MWKLFYLCWISIYATKAHPKSRSRTPGLYFSWGGFHKMRNPKLKNRVRSFILWSTKDFLVELVQRYRRVQIHILRRNDFMVSFDLCLARIIVSDQPFRIKPWEGGENPPRRLIACYTSIKIPKTQKDIKTQRPRCRLNTSVHDPIVAVNVAYIKKFWRCALSLTELRGLLLLFLLTEALFNRRSN